MSKNGSMKGGKNTMTLEDCIKQVHNLSRGQVDGEKISLAKYRQRIKAEIAEKGKATGKLLLLDGEWPYTIYKVKRGIWDYHIPDTRRQAEAERSMFIHA